MPRKIVSFGYKHRKAPGPYSFDVRPEFTYNPFSDLKLRKLTGLSPIVSLAMKSNTPNFYPKIHSLMLTIMRVPDNEVAYVGCTGGKHRSVVVAEQLGQVLQIPVEHLELE